MAGRTVRVGVLGAGAWARGAHIPGWLRDGRAEVVVVADQRRRASSASVRLLPRGWR
jgi:predicted dehydrogenase